MVFSREFIQKQFGGNSDKLVQLLDKASRVKRTWEEEFTDFLSPDEQSVLREICRDQGVEVSFCGGKGNYERAMAVLSPDLYTGEFPISCIRVFGNFKFEKLDHRDYLGSLLALGVKREKLGDINVFEDGAELFAHNDIAEYLCFNLKKIRHTGIKTENISLENSRERLQEFKEMTKIAASLRLDGVVASITGLSRAQALNIINRGEVKVNFMIMDEASKKIKEGDLLSVKGFGRFKLEKITGITRSERLTLLVYKYI